MLTRLINAPTSPKTVAALLGDAMTRVRGIALQSPSTNAANIFFGDHGSQVAYIPPGSSSDVMPISNTADLYISGTSGDKIIILLF